jgi:ribose transport system permease protein
VGSPIAPILNPPAADWRRLATEYALDHAVWFILAVVIATFCIFVPKFAQVGILVAIVEQSTFVGILSVGLSIVIIAGQMDLSVESTMALTAMATAYVAGHVAGLAWLPNPPWLIVPVTLGLSLAMGAAIGAFNSLLVLRFRINAFIVTLATYIFVRGGVVGFSGGRGIFGLPTELRVIATGNAFGVPILAWIMLAVYIAFGVILSKTPFGRYLYLLGGNPVAPFRAGIKTTRVAAWAFVLAGVLAGLTGWLLAARTSGATANLGVGVLFETFAAVVIGGVSLTGGTGRLSGVLAGVLLLSAIRTAINILGMPPQYTQMIQGTLILAAVLLDSLKLSIRSRYL